QAKGAPKPTEIDSGEESDGMSAFKSVQAHEKKQGARRGPSNASMKYFHDPLPVLDERGKL
ncbi:hypothetical protein GALMADRAFT_50527, partial [Galerina marginata CBS 339.88]